MSHAAADASFFELVYRMLDERNLPNPDERRGEARMQYLGKQFVAPCRDGRVPERSCFRQVQCQDLSSRGIAFLSAAWPASEELVFEFGEPPHCTYLTATVAHVTRREGEASPQYLVGCKFTGRIEAESTSPGRG